jgi:hypothetical protein
LRWPPPSPSRQHFRQKIFRCPFLFEKYPSKPGPPQLLQASYAPVCNCIILYGESIKFQVKDYADHISRYINKLALCI